VRLRRPAPKRRERPRKADSKRPPAARASRGAEQARQVGEGFVRALVTGLGEVLAIGREMLAIPAAMALGLAERMGLVVLAGWRWLRPWLERGLVLAWRGTVIAEREVTPRRMLAGVLLVAAVVLAVAQFLDYREVRAGVPAYSDVETVAPPPAVEGSRETTGSAHAYAPLLLAAATVALVLLAAGGRWRVARLLIFVGVAVVAISVLVDAPQGLDEGAVAVQFSGAEARLLGPFWAQLASGVVIAVGGLLFALQLRSRRATRRRPARAGRPRPSAAPIGETRIQGAGS
jgi:hypothetical protein